MASACGYYCSSCQFTLKTDKDWLNHLLSSDHQARAREEFSSWDLQTKERVLVVIGKFPVAFQIVLMSFSNRSGRSKLSGFIWNEKRPRVGLLLIESREKLEDILKGLGGTSQIRFGKYQVLQLKKATDYHDLEWDVFIAQDFRHEFTKGLKTKVKFEMDDEPLPLSKLLKLAISDSDEKHLDGASIHSEPGGVVPFNSKLGSQFDFIRREVEIGDEAYNKALGLMEKCWRILKGDYVHCQLFMFRHWYLKLRGQGVNDLVFFFDANGVLDGTTEGNLGGKHNRFQGGYLKNLIASFTAQQILPAMQSGGVDERKDIRNCKGFEGRSAYLFEDASTKAKFTLVTDPQFAVEAQTCRLLSYLLDFDPRARPLLTLIFYWAEQNRVRMSGAKIPSHLSHALAPEPAGLEWMVVFFLCYKGILPTPREILEGTQHPPICYHLGKSVIDIGFRTDSQFAEEWAASNSGNRRHPVGSDEFVLDLVELSKKFFTFYGELRHNPEPWILNTRDGQLLRLDIMNTHNEVTRLTKEELARLTKPGKTPSKRQVNVNSLWNRRLTILHPVILSWTIPCDEENFFGKISLEMLASAKIIELGIPTLREMTMKEDNSLEGNETNLQNLFRKVNLEDLRPLDALSEEVKQKAVLLDVD